MVGVTVLELKFRVHGAVPPRADAASSSGAGAGSTIRVELTCWCGLHKPFGTLFQHLIKKLQIGGAGFYYGGTLEDPRRGVLIDIEDTPDDIGLVSLDRIDVVITDGALTGVVQQPITTVAQQPITEWRVVQRHLVQQRRLRSPSRSPRRTARPPLLSPRRASPEETESEGLDD